MSHLNTFNLKNTAGIIVRIYDFAYYQDGKIIAITRTTPTTAQGKFCLYENIIRDTNDVSVNINPTHCFSSVYNENDLLAN
jgi:hypothetical protein